MNTYAIISDTMLQIGDQFDRYQIQAHLAQGGMSDIYRAFDLVQHREVAIKIPDQSMIGDPAQFERFQRELEVLNNLQHPAILRGLGSGNFNRIPFLVTELLEGKSLRSLVEGSAPLAPEQAIPLIHKIAEGLAFCHDHGVIHRDLKPENIIVTSEGQPIIMDFGLALTKGAHRVTYSNLSSVMGTPDYMAPEQVEGQRGDERTDVYALGTIFFEMLAGKPPFVGDNNLAIMAQHLNRSAPRLDKQNPAISPQLAAIIATCLQRSPQDRYSDMHAFLNALDHPETADLTILDRIKKTPRLVLLWQSVTVRAIAISLSLIILMAVLAILLQAIRKP